MKRILLLVVMVFVSKAYSEEVIVITNLHELKKCEEAIRSTRYSYTDPHAHYYYGVKCIDLEIQCQQQQTADRQAQRNYERMRAGIQNLMPGQIGLVDGVAYLCTEQD